MEGQGGRVGSRINIKKIMTKYDLLASANLNLST